MQYQMSDIAEQINTAGYVIIPNFLSKDEINIFREEYNVAYNARNDNYSYKEISYETLRVLYPKINKLINEYDIGVNLILPGGMYVNSQVFTSDWHQDHESWYIFQNNKRYANFYIPIIKPESKLSGLSILPFDILENVVPGCSIKIENHGATHYEIKNNTTAVIDDDLGNNWNLPININDHAIHPEINPGDLLLLRGDMIHKTQDTLTERISISIRCIDRKLHMSLDKLQSGCKLKMDMLSKNKNAYNYVVGKFNDLDSRNITVEQYYHNWIQNNTEK